MKTHPVGAKLFHLVGLTDMMKLITAFHNSANMPKNVIIQSKYRPTDHPRK